jgi:hypothetical protein
MNIYRNLKHFYRNVNNYYQVMIIMHNTGRIRLIIIDFWLNLK